MGHRLGLTFDAVADNIDPRAVIERILATVPPPQPFWRDGKTTHCGIDVFDLAKNRTARGGSLTSCTR